MRGLADALAPSRCIVCLKDSTWLCLECWEEVAKAYPSTLPCVGCGEHDTSQGLTCQSCRRNTALKGVVSAGSYHLPHLQRGIRWLKFKGIRAVAPSLAQLLLPRLLLIGTLEELSKKAVLIPLPLHPRRQRERGFNQSALIADSISEATHIPVADILVRHKSTWAQSSLPPELRAANIQNSFALAPDYASHFPTDRRLAILVDDVTTSGSTLRAAAEALSPLKFQQTWGLTIARG